MANLPGVKQQQVRHRAGGPNAYGSHTDGVWFAHELSCIVVCHFEGCCSSMILIMVRCVSHCSFSPAVVWAFLGHLDMVTGVDTTATGPHVNHASKSPALSREKRQSMFWSLAEAGIEPHKPALSAIMPFRCC
jgi:hypothetical protein